MDSVNEVVSQIFKANHHQGGLRCARLFTLDSNFFDELSREVVQLFQTNKPSNVGNKSHRTNWTNPYGAIIQFSLFNTSGRFNDTSSDHGKFIKGKRFHHGDTYPALKEFIETFPGLYNMRLNVAGPKSGLSPHEEHILWKKEGSFFRDEYLFRARFHLPIKTNNDAELMLDSHYFHFDEKNIYFFNNGCIHSASNQGNEHRLHLVWDMFLTQRSIQFMFSDDNNRLPSFLTRVLDVERVVTERSYQPVKEYATMGWGKRWYHRSRLEYLGVQPYAFQNWYNLLTYSYRSLLGKFVIPETID